MGKNARGIAVVGGGLAGLAAAAFLARAGKPVTLFEKSQRVGGRAVTRRKEGFCFNVGPHALYRAGHGMQVLRELGVAFRGGIPRGCGAWAVLRGVKHRLPTGPVSLLATGLLGLRAKLEAVRLLGALGRWDLQPLQSVTLQEWLETEIRHPDVRRLFGGFFRLVTYADDPGRQSAGAALAQLRMALAGNVLYVDGGWQTLVDGLSRVAHRFGVRIVTDTPVVRVERDGAVRGIRLADGTFYPAVSVIVAAGPAVACSLVEEGEKTVLRVWADAAIPVRVACLDVALRRLPQPSGLFALGLDRPLYLSVHSAAAKLAPEGGAVIHAAKYLGSSAAADPRAVEQELEGFLDTVQPGWRDALVVRRFMPEATVAHALVTAAQGGTAGRPGPAVPGIPGLYVAGDWVGQEGMLSDASLASARHAAETILNAARSSNPPLAQGGAVVYASHERGSR